MFRMLGAALVLWLCFHGAVLASPLYTIEELLPLPGHTTAHAHALNDSGQVVGYSYMPLVGEWPLKRLLCLANVLGERHGPKSFGIYRLKSK